MSPKQSQVNTYLTAFIIAEFHSSHIFPLYIYSGIMHVFYLIYDNKMPCKITYINNLIKFLKIWKSPPHESWPYLFFPIFKHIFIVNIINGMCYSLEMLLQIGIKKDKNYFVYIGWENYILTTLQEIVDDSNSYFISQKQKRKKK